MALSEPYNRPRRGSDYAAKTYKYTHNRLWQTGESRYEIAISVLWAVWKASKSRLRRMQAAVVNAVFPSSTFTWCALHHTHHHHHGLSSSHSIAITPSYTPSHAAAPLTLACPLAGRYSSLGSAYLLRTQLPWFARHVDHLPLVAHTPEGWPREAVAMLISGTALWLVGITSSRILLRVRAGAIPLLFCARPRSPDPWQWLLTYRGFLYEPAKATSLK